MAPPLAVAVVVLLAGVLGAITAGPVAVDPSTTPISAAGSLLSILSPSSLAITVAPSSDGTPTQSSDDNDTTPTPTPTDDNDTTPASSPTPTPDDPVLTNPLGTPTPSPTASPTASSTSTATASPSPMPTPARTRQPAPRPPPSSTPSATPSAAPPTATDAIGERRIEVLEASVPADWIRAGQPTLVVATVRNPGEQRSVELRITHGGEPVTTVVVTVPAATTDTYEFRVTFREARSGAVAVAGVSAGQLTVAPPDRSSPTSRYGTDGEGGVGPAGVVVVLLLWAVRERYRGGDGGR